TLSATCAWVLSRLIGERDVSVIALALFSLGFAFFAAVGIVTLRRGMRYGEGSMLAKLVEFRVNLLITFFCAALLILLIKATRLLLPAKSFFDFSKLVGGSSEPFIVDPPGVTGQKLCELIAKYGVPPDSFRKRIACDEDYENLEPFTAEEVDEIYGIA